MSGFHIYTLVRDHNRHHAICVAVERKYTYFVPMEAAYVRMDKLTHEEFKELYEQVPEYPVRRAAEIFLAAPGKEVAPEAREHLEAILADPAYVYDRSLYKEPNVIKENLMATATKKAVATVTAGRRKTDPKAEVHEAAGKVIEAGIKANPVAAKAAKKAAAKPAATEPAKATAKKAIAAAKGRTPALDPETRIKVGDISSVRGGYMKEFIESCQALEKASRGKGFTIAAAVEAGEKLPGAKDKDAAWVRTYVGYSMAPNRGILVLA